MKHKRKTVVINHKRYSIVDDDPNLYETGKYPCDNCILHNEKIRPCTYISTDDNFFDCISIIGWNSHLVKYVKPKKNETKKEI